MNPDLIIYQILHTRFD